VQLGSERASEREETRREKRGKSEAHLKRALGKVLSEGVLGSATRRILRGKEPFFGNAQYCSPLRKFLLSA
jgi:hypothetical protein